MSDKTGLPGHSLGVAPSLRNALEQYKPQSIIEQEQAAQAEADRDLSVGLGDYGKLIGKGGADLVSGIGFLADQGADWLRDKGVAGQVAALPLRGVGAIGDLAGSASESLGASMSPDAQEAMNRSLVTEDAEGKLQWGDGAGDIDVWAAKMAHGIGTMLPTLGTGGLTSAAVRSVVTKSMLKRGAPEEVAKAVAAKAATKWGQNAAVGVGATGAVGGGAQEVFETVNATPFGELMESDTFRQAVVELQGNPEYAQLPASDQLARARELTAERAAGQVSTDPASWAFGVGGALLGDRVLFRMLSGKAATKGILGGMGKGAAAEGISESVQEGGQHWVNNRARIDVAGADIDPMQNVVSRGLEGGLIGMGTGGAVGGLGGAIHGNASPDTDVNPELGGEQVPPGTEQQNEINPGVDPTDITINQSVSGQNNSGPQVVPSDDARVGKRFNLAGGDDYQIVEHLDGSRYRVANLATGDVVTIDATQFSGKLDIDRLISEYGQNSATAGDATRTKENPTGPSSAQFDETRDVPSYLRQNTELDGREARPHWSDDDAQQALREGQNAPSPADLVRQQMEQGPVSESEPEQQTGDIETWQPNWRAGRQERGDGPTREVEGEFYPRMEREQVGEGNRLEGPVIDGEARERGTELPHRDVIYGADGRPQQQEQQQQRQQLREREQQLAEQAQQLNNQPPELGYNGTINLSGAPGDGRNSNYAPPRLSRDQQDDSVEPQSMRDGRTGVGKAINEAGSEADAIWQQLSTLRKTKRGKPFASEKEAQLASRKDEQPVKLPDGYGVAKKEEVAEVQAQQQEQQQGGAELNDKAHPINEARNDPKSPLHRLTDEQKPYYEQGVSLMPGDVVTNEFGESFTVIDNSPVSLQGSSRLIEIQHDNGKTEFVKGEDMLYRMMPERYTDANGDQQVGAPPTVERGKTPLERRENKYGRAGYSVQKKGKAQPAAEAEPAKQTQVVGGAITEVPVADLQLSDDVPQFKDGANKEGVVEPLGGTFNRTGVAPIQVWQREDGRLEVISGRHRLDLARRSGEKTIPAQVHREADGFDQASAATLDAELNIRDNQGKVKDYVQYFQATGIDRAEADRRGHTARALGRRAHQIATGGSEETIAAHRADILSDEAAERITQTAPNDARLQAVGIKAIQEGKSITHATNMMQAVKALSGGQQGDGMGDMFGFDDSAMREAEQMAKLAAKKQREISELLRPQKAVANAGALAEQEGITDNLSPEQRKQRMDNLQQLKAAWDTWSTNPDLVAELRREIQGEEAPVLSSYSEAELQQQADQVKQAQQDEREAQSRYEADQEVDNFNLTGSSAPADIAMAQGQNDMFTQTIGQAEQSTIGQPSVNQTAESITPHHDWRGDLMKTRDYANQLRKAGKIDGNATLKAWKDVDALTYIIDSALGNKPKQATKPAAETGAPPATPALTKDNLRTNLNNWFSPMMTKVGKERDQAIKKMAELLGQPIKKRGETAEQQVQRLRQYRDNLVELTGATQKELVDNNTVPQLKAMAEQFGLKTGSRNKGQLAEDIAALPGQVWGRMEQTVTQGQIAKAVADKVNSNQPVSMADVLQITSGVGTAWTDNDVAMARALDLDTLHPPGQRGEHEAAFEAQAEMEEAIDNEALVEHLKQKGVTESDIRRFIDRAGDISNYGMLGALLSEEAAPITKALGMPNEAKMLVAEALHGELGNLKAAYPKAEAEPAPEPAITADSLESWMAEQIDQKIRNKPRFSEEHREGATQFEVTEHAIDDLIRQHPAMKDRRENVEAYRQLVEAGKRVDGDRILKQVMDKASTKPATQPAAKPESKLDTAATAISDKKRKAAEDLKALLKSRKGSLNSGVDPEVMLAVAKVGALSIADGAVKFAQYVRDVLATTRAVGIDDADVKPFLKESYAAISANPEKYDVTDDAADSMQTPRELRKLDIDQLTQESTDDQRTPTDTTANRPDRPDATAEAQGDLQDDGRGPGGRGADQTGQSGDLGPLGVINPLDDGGAAAAGERGNQPGANEQSGAGGATAGSADGGASGNTGAGGLLAESKAEPAVADRVKQAAVADTKLGEVTTDTDALSEVKARMPFLTEGQAKDVVFAEQRFSKPDGFGVLFTNGTGTGKTFSGLGIARRFADQGKDNILIVVPKQTIADAWNKAGKQFFDLDIKRLKDTRDNGGSGPVVTTYANLANNPALLEREWDLIIPDEAHYLSSDQKGTDTQAQDMLRMLAYKPGMARSRVYALNQGEVDQAKDLAEQAKVLEVEARGADFGRRQQLLDQAGELRNRAAAIWKRLDAKVDKQKQKEAGIKDADKPRAAFLSATPFAYEKSVRWANGFLFDWGDAEATSYNSGGAYEQFMMQHFGYRMRYNKLTEPDAKVDSGLMQRSFNAWLKREGTLSARMLESEHDYDRRFVLTENAIGNKVDEALQWLSDNSRTIDGMQRVAELVRKNFAYLPRMYLLESIKAREVIPHVQENLRLGRKVLIVHDFKQGGSEGNPLGIGLHERLDDVERAAYNQFRSRYASLIKQMSDLPSAIETLTEAFPDAMVYNGSVAPKKRVAMQDDFNQDGKASVIIAQSDAMREGVSIHDTTGQHQRASYNLGLPVKPTASIQLEGRTYRTGQKSDAIFRYLTIGTTWERTAFATTIAGRASTAENLAMGEEARGLKESFIQAYEQADSRMPGFEGEGKGGKETDRALASALTPWDMAKSFYFGTKQQGGGRGSKDREGNDYFATPEPLGLKMVHWADPRGGEELLEPSVGHAAIGRWFPENTRNRAIEQSAQLASQAALRFGGEVVNGDFEAHHISNKYDAIVMNPPFGSGGKTAADHVRKAIKHLREEGRIVALVPTGPAADKQFDKLLYGDDADRGVYQVAEIRLPNVTFERAGTKVATRVLVLERQGDESKVNRLASHQHDLTDVTDINELFDRLQELDLSPRLITEQSDDLGSGRAAPGSDSARHEQAANHGPAPEGLVEHVTQKGKTLRGIVRTDLTKDQAREIDPYTFKKDGGFFIREKHLGKESPRFSKSVSSSVAGLPREQAESIARNIMADWKGAPKLVVVASEAELPAAIADAIAEQNAHGEIEGVHYRGTVYVVADNIHDASGVERVLLHEAVGHYGIARMIGPTWKHEMNRLYLKLGGDPGIEKLAKRFGINLDKYKNNTGKMTTDERNRMMVDELLAHVAQQNLEPTIIDRVVAQIKKWLRDWGLGRFAQYGKADVLRLLEGAKRAVYEGTDGKPLLPDDVKFSRKGGGMGGGGPKGDNFKHWFGDSKVVDKSGQPLVVYHGTRGDFDSFDTARAGEATGNSFGEAVFFTDDPGVAGGYSAQWMGSESFREARADEDKGLRIAREALLEHGYNSDEYQSAREDTHRLAEARRSAAKDVEEFKSPSEGANLVPAYLSLKDPYIFDAEGRNWIEVNGRAFEQAEAGWHDGVIIKNVTDSPNSTAPQASNVYVAFYPGQIKSAIGNNGDYNPYSDDIRFSRNSEAATSGLDKLNLGPKPDVIDQAKEKLQALRELDRATATSWLARIGRKANTEMLDALAPIKYIERALGLDDADRSGYVAARLASGSSSTMMGAMLHGIPQWKDGIIQRKSGTGEADALLGILQPLGKDLHNWLGWMAGHRAEILMAQGRENLLTAEEIQALKDLGNGKEQQFNAAKQKWNAFNGAILDLAQEAGMVSAEARAGFESEWYIPFFRETEDGDVLAPFSSKGVANQRSIIKQLKGGTNKTNDLLENIFHTTSKTIDAAMKNHAARKTVENLMDSGVIEVIERPTILDMRAKDKGQGVISFRHNGEDVYARVADEDLFKALTFLERKPFEDPFTKVGMSAKRLLTAAVTSSPEFMLRNFLRDMLSAWTINKDNYNPVDAFKGAYRAFKVDKNTMDMMFAGASFMGGYVNAQDPNAMADTVRKALRRKGMTPEQITRYEKSIIRNAAQAKGVVADAWAKYQQYGEAAENGTREAVYEAAIKAGKSKAQAAFEAKDLMDFSMLGSSRMLQWFVAVLPFFNARVQGLGKLSREFKENPAGIAKRGGLILAGSAALLAMNWDNEEYEALPDWDKDMNWHFWIGDQHVRIPKPFEVGVLFGTIPERALRAMGGKDTGAEFGKAVSHAVLETFALNPIPQAINPALEVFMNYDHFRKRNIENQYEQTLMPQARYDERTSQTMRELGELTGMSPKQLEHLVNGYLGTMGAYSLMATDWLVNLAKDNGATPATHFHNMPVIKAIYRGDGSVPPTSTKYIGQLYDMLDEVTTLHNTVNAYRKDNRIEDANELIAERGSILRARSSLTQAQRQLRQLRNQMDMVRRDRSLDSQQKRDRLDRLLARRNDLAARVAQQNRHWFE